MSQENVEASVRGVRTPVTVSTETTQREERILARLPMIARATHTELNRHVFRDAPPGPRLTVDRVVLYAALALLATAVQLLRAWSLDPFERVFAEDGFVFLAGAQDGGLSHLLDPYNGYLQTSSRVVGELVALLPVEWWAAAMALAGGLIVTGCAFVVWRTSAALIQDRWLRATLAAMVILFGALGPEMVANVVNTIWFISFACFWLLLWRPRSELAAGGAGALLFLGAISHTVPLFLAPLWLARAICVRDRADLLIVAGFAAGAAFQLGVSHDDLATTQGIEGIPAGQPFSSEPFWDSNLIPAYAQRVVGGAIGGLDSTGPSGRGSGGPGSSCSAGC